MAQINRQQQRHAMALATARRHVNDGDLSLGEQLLAGTCAGGREPRRRPSRRHRAPPPHRRRRRPRLFRCDQARRCGTSRPRAASRRSSDPHQKELADLAPRVLAAVAGRLQDAIEQGHLDEAGALLQHLRVLDPTSQQVRRQQVVLDGLRRAWQQIQSGAFGEARHRVSRLLPATDDAPWLKRVAEQLGKADQAITELQVGPLAWLGQPAAT